VEINDVGVLSTTSNTFDPAIPAEPFVIDQRVRGYQVTAAYYTTKNAKNSGTF